MVTHVPICALTLRSLLHLLSGKESNRYLVEAVSCPLTIKVPQRREQTDERHRFMTPERVDFLRTAGVTLAVELLVNSTKGNERWRRGGTRKF